MILFQFLQGTVQTGTSAPLISAIKIISIPPRYGTNRRLLIGLFSYYKFQFLQGTVQTKKISVAGGFF